MGRSKKYGNITLKPEDRKKLVKLANSQTSEYRKVQRAKIILLSADMRIICQIVQKNCIFPGWNILSRKMRSFNG